MLRSPNDPKPGIDFLFLTREFCCLSEGLQSLRTYIGTVHTDLMWPLIYRTAADQAEWSGEKMKSLTNTTFLNTSNSLKIDRAANLTFLDTFTLEREKFWILDEKESLLSYLWWICSFSCFWKSVDAVQMKKVVKRFRQVQIWCGFFNIIFDHPTFQERVLKNDLTTSGQKQATPEVCSKPFIATFISRESLARVRLLPRKEGEMGGVGN